MRSRPDIVFARAKVAVFVDGCFWHRCPEHGSIPTNNHEWWADKLQANVDRDTRTTVALEAEGWTVLRIWEHEPTNEAVDRIVAAVKTSC